MAQGPNDISLNMKSCYSLALRTNRFQRRENQFLDIQLLTMSKIEWTGKTWNFLKGCNLVSKGCENCYAMRMAWRLQNNPKMAKEYEGTARKTAGGKIQWTGKVNIDKERMLLPLQVKKPTVWFVNSMSDLFHESVPFEIIDRAFAVMVTAMQHTFQILTKRPRRMLEYFNRENFQDYITTAIAEMAQENDAYYEEFSTGSSRVFEFGLPVDNIWLGVSIEDQKTANERLPLLLKVPSAVRFLSCEPLLGPIDFYKPSDVWPADINHPWRNGPILQGIHWVICGGESGPGARPMHPYWARSLRDQCQSVGISFFFKQWGEYLPFEISAQAPFWRDCATNEEYDGHGMNFTNPETDQPGRFMGASWYDSMESIIMNVESGGLDCNYLKVGKKKAGRLLDGQLYDQFPKRE